MTPDLFTLSGKIVLVSGGSRGIGWAIAEAFHDRGAKVIITGRDENSLREAYSAAGPARFEMSSHVCDVADTDAINSVVETIVADHGRIDTLVNSAGINNRMPVLDYTPEQYDQIMDINLRGAFFMSQTVGKTMVAQGGGSQINIDSLSTYGSLTDVAPYAMSKSGMASMTRTMALEWGRHGVRVNAVAPGFILTDLTKKLWSDPNLQAWNKTVCPLGRTGTVEDLIGTAIFLASEASAFLTGQVIRVDGGVSAGINWPIRGDYEVKRHN